MKRILWVVACVCVSFGALASSLNRIVVFGDSLSDNGNLYEYMNRQLPLSPPYYEGRFTNGPVWVELLAQTYYPDSIKLHLKNYAFGGAGIMSEDEDDEDFFTLNTEIDSYFLAHHGQADAETLYVVWIGANNYIALPDDTDAAVDMVVTGIQRGLKRLIDKGAKHILVVNVPQLGKMPAARDFEAVDELTHASIVHDQKLRQALNENEALYPDVQWLFYDMLAMMDDLFRTPAEYGFTNLTDTCYEDMLDPDRAKATSILKIVSAVNPAARKSACDGYLFFDPVHPSELAHVMMASRVRKLLDNAGITFE